MMVAIGLTEAALKLAPIPDTLKEEPVIYVATLKEAREMPDFSFTSALYVNFWALTSKEKEKIFDVSKNVCTSTDDISSLIFIEMCDIVFCPNLHCFFVNKEQCSLTKTEFLLTKLLILHAPGVVSYQKILRIIWEQTEDTSCYTNKNISTHISHIRKHLKKSKLSESIGCIPSTGYYLNIPKN